MSYRHILLLEDELNELPYDPETETIEDLQLAGLSLIQKKKAFRYGMDSVLLADFPENPYNNAIRGSRRTLSSRKTACP